MTRDGTSHRWRLGVVEVVLALLIAIPIGYIAFYDISRLGWIHLVALSVAVFWMYVGLNRAFYDGPAFPRGEYND